MKKRMMMKLSMESSFYWEKGTGERRKAEDLFGPLADRLSGFIKSQETAVNLVAARHY